MLVVVFWNILALIIGYGAIVFLIHAIYSFVKSGCGRTAPYVASVGQMKEKTLSLAFAYLKKAKKRRRVADLGSGTGTLLIPLARRFPQHHFVGYEWDFYLMMWAKFRGRKLKNITWKRQNYMKQDLGEFDMVMSYIIKPMGESLGKKLVREAKPGGVIITSMYPLNHLIEKKRVVSSLWGMSVNVYVYGKKK